MKKLLILLGSVSIIASSGATLGWTIVTSVKSSIESDVKNFIAGSSIAAQAAILNDKNGANINHSYSTNSLSMLKIKDVFGAGFIKNIGGNNAINDQKTIEYLQKHIFGDDRYKVNANDMVNQNDNEFIKRMGNDDSSTLSGKNSTADLIGIISSAVNGLFGTNFIPTGTASLLEGVISGGALTNAVKGFLTPDILKTINKFLSPDNLQKISSALVDKEENKISISQLADERFENMLNDVLGLLNIGPVVSSNSAVKQENKIINLIVDVIKYLKVIVYYVNSFNQFRGNLEYDQIRKYADGYTQIFDKDLKNSEVITKVLTETIDMKKFNTINFQEIISTLQMFFSPDSKDKEGFGLQKLFVILFQTPSDKSLTNPFFGQAIKYLRNNLKTDGWITNKIKELLEGIDNDIVKKLIKNFWNFIVDKGFPYIINKIEEIANSFISQGKINTTLINLLASLLSSGGASTKPIGEFLKSNLSAFDNLFAALYKGDFIPKLLKALNQSNLVKINNDALSAFKNIKSILNQPLGNILKIFGLDIETKAIFLYGLKYTSLSDIINSAATFFGTNRNAKITDINKMQKYNFKLENIKNLLDALNSDSPLIEFNDRPAGFENVNLNNTLVAVLLSIAYPDKVKLPNGLKSEVSIPSYLLGLNKKDNKLYFEKNSLFGALYKAYGNDESITDPIEKKKMKETMTKLANSLIKISNWIEDSSIKEYSKDMFGHYFDRKNWTTKFVSAKNFYDPYKDAFITYDLIFKNPKTKTTEVYEVLLKRPLVTHGSDTDQKWIIHNIKKK